MKVLQINKFFRQVGGPERYMFEVSRLLQQQGNEVVYFSMRHPANVACAQDPYFVSPIEYGDTTLGYKLKTMGRTFGKTVYSFESKRKIHALIEAERPDVAHVHMISHQISPSILDALSDLRVPVIQSVHDYKLVCPSYHLYIHHKNAICERCLGGRYYHAVLQRCVKGSLAASALAAGAQYWHKATQIYEENIDYFVAPSQFMAHKITEGGVPAEKVRVLPYGIDIDAYQPQFEPGDYALYFGRLSPEKGLMTLLRAVGPMQDIKLVVIGEGPERGKLERYAKDRGLNHVDFVGYRDGDELKALVRGARFAVVPSEWYENSPLAVYEAYALGKPVICSRIGGIPELVDDGVTGHLFTAGDADELAEKMKALSGDVERCREMGRRGRERVERYCADQLDGLMSIYKEAMARH